MLGFNKATTIRRRLSFFLLILFAFASLFALRGLPWPRNIDFQRLWGVVALCLSAVAGILAIIKLTTRKKSKYVFIGAGFLGVALFEGYSLFVPLSSIALLWTLSQVFLSAYLLFSLKGWKEKEGGQEALKPIVYISAGACALIIIALVTLISNFDPYSRIAIFGRPIELVSTLMFAAAVFGYYQKGYWEFKYFEFWLVLSLLAAFFAQLAMSLSTTYFDGTYFLGIIFKNLGYLFALVGLLESTWAAFREVEAEKTYLAGKTKGETYLREKEYLSKS